METGLEQIAAKARNDTKFRFTSLAHHVTRERVWKNLQQIRYNSAPGSDGQSVSETKENFDVWIEPMLQSMHRRGYKAPPSRRVYIPKPGKKEKRPLGVSCVSDRAPDFIHVAGKNPRKANKIKGCFCFCRCSA